MKGKGFIILGGMLAAIGVAAVYYYERQITLLQQLGYQLIGAKPGQDLTTQKAQIALTIRITSSSTLDALVKQLYVDVYLNGSKQAVVQNQDPFVIPAKGYSDAVLLVTVSPDLIVGDIISFITSYLTQSNFAIYLEGFVKIQEGIVTIPVPFTYNTTLNQILSS